MAGHRYNERSPQDSVSLIEKQDAKLDRFLDDMKPYVLRLPHKLGEFYLSSWSNIYRSDFVIYTMLTFCYYLGVLAILTSILFTLKL